MYQILAIRFMLEKTASLTDSMWSLVKVNFVRSDTGENGEQNGLFSWTDKGVLVDHGIFKDGERDGETVQYWPDTGKLKVKAQYRAGKLNGQLNNTIHRAPSN